MAWTQEREALLEQLWGEGLSASEVAMKMGQGLTRNAVIGKVHRLGLNDRNSKGYRSQRHTQRPAPSDRRRMHKSPVFAKPVEYVPKAARQKLALAELAEIQLTTTADDVARRTLLTLEDDECRWPVGDPILQRETFGYCGSEKVPGLPYCLCHMKRAYQPPIGNVHRNDHLNKRWRNAETTPETSETAVKPQRNLRRPVSKR